MKWNAGKVLLENILVSHFSSRFECSENTGHPAHFLVSHRCLGAVKFQKRSTIWCQCCCVKTKVIAEFSGRNESRKKYIIKSTNMKSGMIRIEIIYSHTKSKYQVFIFHIVKSNRISNLNQSNIYKYYKIHIKALKRKYIEFR